MEVFENLAQAETEKSMRLENGKSMTVENENSTNILNDFFDVDIDGFTEEERNQSTSEKFENLPKKLEWPLTKEI